MRDGQDAVSPFGGGAGFISAQRSLAREAEQLVRAGGGAQLAWEGLAISTYFQPIYCVRREVCLGFEALARVADRDGVSIPSEEFFARRPSQGRPLLDWACRALHMRTFATVDPGDRMLFINVHPEAAVNDVRRGRDFAELVRYYGLSPRRVCIEILEHPCSDERVLAEAVEAYRSVGASIAMDDFGVGSSNFDRVVALKPDLVKIDKSILAGAVGNDKASRVLPAMIELLHELAVRVAVEGIETRAGAALAIDARADYVQGMYFATPRTALGEEIRGRGLLDTLLHPASLAA